MRFSIAVLLAGILVCFCVAKPHKHHKKARLNQVIDDGGIDPDFDEYPGRKSMIHDPAIQLERLRESLEHQQNVRKHKVDPCFYKRCKLGEDCALDDDNVAKCVCKKKCREHHKPVCGSDGEYYENKCEMHRHACMANVPQLYDARHKDCYYKASDCSTVNMRNYKSMLMEYYKNMVVESNDIEEGEENRSHATKQHKVIAEEQRNETKSLMRKKSSNRDANSIEVTLVEDDPLYNIDEDVVEYESVDEPEDETENESGNELMEDEVDELLTADLDGELIKFMFNFFDLDNDGLVGSEEVTQVMDMQLLEDVIPSPCTLHHLLYYGDRDQNKAVDLPEMFDLFNVTVLKLSKSEHFVTLSGAVNNPLKLKCGIRGDETPIWKRYGQEIDESNDYRISGDILHITDLSMENAGNVTCSAHKRPELIQTINIKVLLPPRVKIFPKMQHAHVDSSATIVCVAKGISQPEITWLKNGEMLDTASGSYLLMDGGTELHFNNVQLSDDGVYSCIAKNDAGESRSNAALKVERLAVNQEPSQSDYYTIFHGAGVSFVRPETCDVVRHLNTETELPGLLRENTICGNDDLHKCAWSSSIMTSSDLIFAAQPQNDRVLILDPTTQHINEVITTDIMPVKLMYLPSSDQVFVLCLANVELKLYTMQVIGKASEKGVHFAEHVRPVLNSGKADYDFFIKDMFVPSENVFNPTTNRAFVTHQNEQMIYILDLYSLKYVDYIDLTAYQCTPAHILYQPIGGLLRVICTNEIASHFLLISEESKQVVDFEEDSSIENEYFSDDFRYLVRLYPKLEKIAIDELSTDGEINQTMIIRTNFEVADVSFTMRKYDSSSNVLYLISSGPGNLMYVDLLKKKVQLINDHQVGTEEQLHPWQQTSRSLTPSGWFGRFLMTSGNDGVEVISLNGNQVTCRLDDITHAATSQWHSIL